MGFKLQTSRGLLSPEDLAKTERNRLLAKAELNPKTRKGLEKLPILASTLTLAPSWNSGYQTCVMASPKCGGMSDETDGERGFCFFNSQRTDAYGSINDSRIRKTRYFIEYHDRFMARLVTEIDRRCTMARRHGVLATFRLNVMSDIEWERIPCVRDGVAYDNVMSAYPEAQYYDYTKVITRLRRPLPPNYSLTFSLSESNDNHAREALSLGFNVTVVLGVRKSVKDLPASWGDVPVIDGDVHDYRYLDPRGVIVGLRPKGYARASDADVRGFIRPLDAGFNRDAVVTFVKRPTLMMAQA